MAKESGVMIKTTKKDFKLFKKECRKWIKFFGLKGWDIAYEHYDKNVNHRTAEVEFNPQGQRAWVRLGKEIYESEYSDENIKMSAFHEICHLVLAKMWTCANSRYLNPDELETAEHEVINTLQNTVFKKIW